MNIECRGLWAPLLFATLFVFGQPAIADENEAKLKADTKTEAEAATTADLERDAKQALQSLVGKNSVAAEIAGHAEAVLVFPNLIKAGLVFGGAYGEGVLLDDGEVAGYFNSVTASWGLQAGAQSYSYVVFLMTEKAISYLDRSSGWELGVGPTLVVVNEGVARNLSTSTLKEDSYAFIFNQQGVMGSLSIEGTKITRIER
ncbi:lipid-binding SYLF domain-containing protein [Algiphilus aromaticivorans]|uniref:lipid-binding SYLF domain-containing protein n=1 Tax=Algiphilus aromaticivorans TaxID=382454 RepID=UPI000693AA11|nr:lipid-binding SYLF domain-containing protein [Algiphilus aromaticivorans]